MNKNDNQTNLETHKLPEIKLGALTAYSGKDSDQGFSSYLQKIKSIPCLTLEEEQYYANKFINEKDTEAAHKIVLSHLKLVAKIASGFKGYGFAMVELVSEGNVGLLQALKRFKPDLGFRFSTYCVWWIKASIQEYILRSWSLVKMGTTAAQKKIFFNLGKIRRKIFNYENESSRKLNEDDISIIAKNLGVTAKEVSEMSSRMSGYDSSLNETISEESNREIIDTIPDDENSNQEIILAQNQEISFKRKFLEDALKNLSEREKDIFVSRRLKDEPETLERLSNFYGISRERVRQVEMRAYEKVKEFITKQFDTIYAN